MQKISGKITGKMSELVLGRMIKNLYIKLNEKDRKIMVDVFESNNAKMKEAFTKIYFPNFKQAFAKEAKKVALDLKREMKRLEV